MPPFDLNFTDPIMSSPPATPSNFMLDGLDPISDYALMNASMGRSAGSVGSYVQNYERRKAIRGSLYPPSTRASHRSQAGPMVGMPNAASAAGIDPSQISAANEALAPFGLQTPSHVNPFLFFHDQDADGNATWAGKHPHVARALEGAMVGATVPSGATVGDNISNIVRTVMGIPGLYAENAQAQINAPFQEAERIQGLRKTTAQIDSENAMAAYHRAAAAQMGQREPAVPSIHFNNDGEALVWNPAIHDYQKRADLSGQSKPPREHEFSGQDYIDHQNIERHKAGQPPLDSKGELAAFKEYKKASEAGKAANRRPYVDPNVKFRVDQAQKDVQNAQSTFNSLKPKDYIESQLWEADSSDAGRKRWADYQAASKNLIDAKEAKNKLMEDHYHYSDQAAQEETSEADTSDIPQPIAPVRMPGTRNITTNNGQSGTLIRDPNGPPGRVMIAPQPGTSKPTPKKKKDTLGIL
jgi:hypothetical protein